MPSESELPSLAQDDLEDLVADPSVSVETIPSIPTDPPAETSTVPESTGQGKSGSVETPMSEGLHPLQEMRSNLHLVIHFVPGIHQTGMININYILWFM